MTVTILPAALLFASITANWAFGDGNDHWRAARRQPRDEPVTVHLPRDPITRNADDLEPDATGQVRLFGDPDATMPYAFRFKVSPGDPGERAHRHAGFEFGTVLEGTVWVAVSDRPRREDAIRLDPGAFIYVPPDMPHAVWADRQALLEVHGVGPRGPTRFLEPGADR